MSADKSKVAIIGFGAMARSLATSLAANGAGITLGAALVSPDHDLDIPQGIRTFHNVAELIAWQPALVVECASHRAVQTSVVELLEAGIDVVIVSIGAMGNPETLSRLDAAAGHGGRLTVASGAIGGLDILRSARLAGLDEVIYTGCKPPAAWAGTPAEQVLNLATLDQKTVFFEGSASQAALLYPKNANVTAAVALAGIGFERTQVTLCADPAAKGNSHHVSGRGAFGSFAITLDNNPLPDNPKTSWLAALSVEQAVLRHFQTMEL